MFPQHIENELVAKLATEAARFKEQSAEALNRTVRAYAIGDPNDATDSKTVYIPDGYAYDNHWYTIWTANPPEAPSTAEGNQDWYVHVSVGRDGQGNINSVTIDVKAWARGGFLGTGARKWIGADLTVSMTKKH